MSAPWETYWRGGYTVSGASDVIVTDYGRTKEQATAVARLAADKDVARLVEVGVSLDVTVWTERWRTRQVVETDKRGVVDTITPPRRTERVELRQSTSGVRA